MRVIHDETYRHFSDWLLRIGTVNEPHDEHDLVILPENIVTDSLQDMTNIVYPPTQHGNQDLMQDHLYMSEY